MKIEDKLIELEEKCVSKIEEHFHKYLLEDVLDTNGIVGLFTDEDYYLYWLMNGIEVNELIDEHIELKSKQETLLSLIKFKRIIDEHLLNYKDNESEILDDLEIESITTSKINIVIDEVILSKVHNSLTEFKFINLNYQDFKKHFNNSNIPSSKIEWHGKLNDLIYLIVYLHSEKMINVLPRKYKLDSINIIASLFIHKGSLIKTNTINTYSKEVPEKTKSALISKIKKVLHS